MLCSGNLCAMPSSAQHASYISRVRASVGRMLCATARRILLSLNSSLAARNAMPAIHSAVSASAQLDTGLRFGAAAGIAAAAGAGAGASTEGASEKASPPVKAVVRSSGASGTGTCSSASPPGLLAAKKWKLLSTVTGMHSRAITKNHSAKCSAGESRLLNASLKPMTAAKSTAEYAVTSKSADNSFIPPHPLPRKAPR